MLGELLFQAQLANMDNCDTSYYRTFVINLLLKGILYFDSELSISVLAEF